VLGRTWIAGGLLACALLALSVTETVIVFDSQSVTPVSTDFEGTIWQPARDVLDGRSPFPDPHTERILAVYPPSAFLPLLPLAALDVDVAAGLFRFALAIAAFVTLVVLGVRDPRCHVLWLLSPLVVVPALLGNATLLVGLGAALLWRYRESAPVAALALTAAIAFKLYLAPLWLWLVFTGRYRAAMYSAVLAPVVVLVSWALIGFDGLTGYPDLMRAASDYWGDNGDFLYALGRQVGLGDASWFLSGGVALGLFVAAWFKREDDIAAFTLAAAGALALSPIGWTFYVGVLLVPLAARWPSYSPAWLLLPLFWVVSYWHTPLDFLSAEQSVVTLALTSVLVLVVVASYQTRPLASGSHYRYGAMPLPPGTRTNPRR
jgi:hypothetical protein